MQTIATLLRKKLVLAGMAAALVGSASYAFAAGISITSSSLGAGNAGALLAVIKLGENNALGNVVSNVGANVDQDTGNLESNLGCDARLDGSKTEDLNGYIVVDARDLHRDGP